MEFSTWVSKQPRGVLKRIEREANVGYTTLHRLMRGERIDSYSLAKRVSDATEGAVTVDDLCEASSAVAPDVPASAPAA